MEQHLRGSTSHEGLTGGQAILDVASQDGIEFWYLHRPWVLPMDR